MTRTVASELVDTLKIAQPFRLAVTVPVTDALDEPQPPPIPGPEESLPHPASATASRTGTIRILFLMPTVHLRKSGGLGRAAS